MNIKSLIILSFIILLAWVGSGYSAVCSNPGIDGTTTISGVINTYYPGGNGTVSAGSTYIPVNIGNRRGSAEQIKANDLVLVMQMQDADIDSSNTNLYGGSSPGTGYTNLNNSGVYEYAVVTSTYTTGSASILITSPLQNTYRNSSATATAGQRTYQVIRVPQYSSATLLAAGTVYAALPWDGSTGGMVAFDVAGNLNLNGSTVEVSGRGFRGGGGQCSSSNGTADTMANTDFRTRINSGILNLNALGTGGVCTAVNTPVNCRGRIPNGSKGEGIAGTPRLIFDGASVIDTTINGYPNGTAFGYDFGRGAPGNAGGGGSDGDSVNNDENTGGGGGGAYSIGGMGGYGWTPGTPPGSPTGGYGGYSVPMVSGLLTMGGGGGAGSTNNCTGGNGHGDASSGSPGGGIVMVRTRTITGTGTINANGNNANNSITNDASGGGGGGGAVLFFATNSSLSGLNINVKGGNGGSNTGNGTPHGPGGGGSGGFAVISSPFATVNYSGGSNGTTATSSTSTAQYGSTPSSGGIKIYPLQATDIPGAGANALCSPSMTVTKTTSKTDTVQGGITRYVLTVTNASGYGLASGVTLNDVLPSPFNLNTTESVTLTGGAIRTATSNPASGATTPVWGSFTIPGGGSVAIAYTVNVPAGAALATYQNPGSVSYTNPAAGSPGAAATITPGDTYYTDGGTVPGSNYNSSSSNQEDVTVWSPATISKSFAPASIIPGGSSTLSIVITNPNSVLINNAALTDTYPAGVTNTTSPAGAISGAGCFGTVTAANGGTSVALSGGVIPAAGSCTITVNVTFSMAGNYINTIAAGALTNTRNITNMLPASATLNQAAIQPPSVTKTFVPAQIQQGGISTLTLAVVNGGTTNLTGIGFTDTLTNMSVATPSVTSNSCDGTLTATAGASSIALANASLNAGASCTITVQVTSNTISAPEGHANTVTNITSTQSGAGLDSNTTNLVVAATPTITKGFAPTVIAPSGSSTLTFTITNPGNIPLTNATFSDNMGNIKIAATATAGGSCSGASTNTLYAGSTSITLTGLTIPAAGSCTVTVGVTSTVSGIHSNIANGVSSSETPTPGPQSPEATLTVPFTPMLAKSFAGSIQVLVATSYSTMTITVSNPNTGVALSNISFTDNLVNMRVYTTPATTNSCGGTLSAVASSSLVSLTGVSLAAGGSCAITVRIGSSVPSPAGGHPNTVSATSTETGATQGPADTAYLNVLQSPTISKAFSLYSVPLNTTTVMSLTITNPNSVPLTNVKFTDTFPVQLTTTNVDQNYIGVGRGTCVGVIPSAQVAGTYYTTRTFSSFSIDANSSCTIMVDVVCSTSKGGTACANGNYSNTTTGATSNETPAIGPVSNTATLAVGRVGISKAFSPAAIVSGGTSDISFTLDNDSGANRTGMTFTDSFPPGMVVANITPVAPTTCTYTAPVHNQSNTTLVAGVSSGIRVNGIALNNNQQCTITMRVTVAAKGSYPNTTAGVNYGTTGPPSNTATLQVYDYATITKGFNPNAIDVYENSIMTFTLTNGNTTALTGANFTDTLTGFKVALPANIGGTCAGVTNSPSAPAAGDTALNLTVPNLLPGSCTITIPVSGDTAGAYPNTTSGVLATQTGASRGAASNTASLTVRRLPVQITKMPSVTTASPGAFVSYDIGYANPNVMTFLQNVVITDSVPQYTEYDSASCSSLPPGITSCAVSFTPPPAGNGNGIVSWTLGGTLNAGSSGNVRLTVRVR